MSVLSKEKKKNEVNFILIQTSTDIISFKERIGKVKTTHY